MPRAALKLNLVLLYSAEIAAKILGMLVFGLLARTLSPARYGDLEFAVGSLALLNLVQDAGLPSYAARESAKHPELQRALAGQLLVLRTGVLAIALLLLGAVAWLSPRDALARTLILLYGCVLLPMPLDFSWSFQARDEMSVIAWSALLRQVVLCVGTFLWVHGASELLYVPLLDAAGLACAVALQQVLFRRREGAIQIRAHLSDLGRVFRDSAPIASALVWALRLYAPLLALGFFCSSSATGLFGAGHRIVVAAHTFVWLYFFNLLPSIARTATRADLVPYRRLIRASLRVVGWVAFFGACLGHNLGPLIVRLVYGETLQAASGPFTLMVWMLVAAFISGHHRFSLLAFQRQAEEFLAGLCGALLSVLACVAFGHALTEARAAGIFVASEVVTLLIVHVQLARTVERLPALGLCAAPAFVAACVLSLAAWLELDPLRAAALSCASFAAAALLSRRQLRESFADLQLAVRRHSQPPA